MRAKLYYFAMILVTIYLVIMYDGEWLLGLLGFEILLYVFLFMLSWYFKQNVRLTLQVNIPLAEKKEPIPIEILVENQGILPASNISYALVYSNAHENIYDRRSFRCSADAKTTERISFDIISEYSGRIEVSLQKIRIKDYLGIFSRRLKQDQMVYVNILPKMEEYPVEITERTRNYPVDGDEYEQNQSGDDPSEIYETREFRDGDRLQKINWKMSARTDTLMTKVYSMPKGYKVLILFDLFRSEQEAGTMQAVDEFLTKAASVCSSILEEGCSFYTAWYDAKDEKLVRRGIQTEEELYTMLDKLLGTPLYEKPYDLEEGYHACYPGQNYSTTLKIGIGSPAIAGDLLEI